jgi:hypothetical protein
MGDWIILNGELSLGASGMKAIDEPFPGYIYDAAASSRADQVQKAARDAILKHGDGSLFDTEPQLISKIIELHVQNSEVRR